MKYYFGLVWKKRCFGIAQCHKDQNHCCCPNECRPVADKKFGICSDDPKGGENYKLRNKIRNYKWNFVAQNCIIIELILAARFEWWHKCNKVSELSEMIQSIWLFVDLQTQPCSLVDCMKNSMTLYNQGLLSTLLVNEYQWITLDIDYSCFSHGTPHLCDIYNGSTDVQHTMLYR